MFINLASKSEYSFLTSILRTKEIAKSAKKYNQAYVGICDQNNLFNSYNFQQTLSKEEFKIPVKISEEEEDEYSVQIQPVIGVDLTIMHMFNEKDFGNIKLFSLSDRGHKNIIKLTTLANVGKKEFPYITFSDLKGNIEDVVCLSGGIESELLSYFEDEDDDTFENIVKAYLDLFGKENYYIELTYHKVPIEEKFLNSEYVQNVIKKYSLQTVWTQNAHYASKSQAAVRSIAVEFSHNKNNTGPKEGYAFRDKYTDYNDEFYLKSPTKMEEVAKPWLNIYPDAISNTLVIARRCAGQRVFKEQALPTFPLPPGYTAEEYFRKVAWEGFEKRFGLGDFAPGKTREDYEKQLEYEIETIEKMGFTNYFLITQDFIQYCKDTEVYLHPEKYFPRNLYDWTKIPKQILNKNVKYYVGPGRGSAAGSLLAYCLEITETIDPIKYELYFERFLNPERVSMPDIDMDFSNRDREKVVEFCQYKYGFDHVCQIVTFTGLNPKSLFKRYAKSLGMPYAEADAITKQFPSFYIDDDGKEHKIESLEDLKKYDSIRKLIKENETVENIFKNASSLDKLPANTGKHAAGVIIGSKPIEEKMALMEVDGVLVSQFEKNNAEDIGNLKMDFLGLATEDLIQDTIEIIEKNKGLKLDIDTIPLDDKKTYELFQRGETSNVFQLEGGGMKKLLKQMQPTEFEHISAVLALYR